MRTPSSQKCRLDLAPPLADRFILGIVPIDCSPALLLMPFGFRLTVDTLPSEYDKQRLQVRLGCIQLSLSCPFRRLHTFCFLRPARLLPPAFGYGAPHLSARGTLTLQNNALLSTHFRVADHPGVGPSITTSASIGHMATSPGKCGFQCYRSRLILTSREVIPITVLLGLEISARVALPIQSLICGRFLSRTPVPSFPVRAMPL
jgi:hypothetical protein